MGREAPTAPCARCGAALAVVEADLGGPVRCQHCGHEGYLDPAVRETLRRYLRQLESERDRVERAQRVGGGAAAGAERAARQACVACGGAVDLPPGHVIARCPHCGATVVASSFAMSAALYDARQAAESAEDAAARVERRAFALGRDHGEFSRTSLLWLPAALCAFVGVYALAEQQGPSQVAGAALGLGLAAVLTGAATVAWLARFTRRRDRARRFEAVAARMGTRVARRGRPVVVRWLDAYWTGPNPSFVKDALEEPPPCWTIVAASRGQAALVLLSEGDPGRIVALLASTKSRGYGSPAATSALGKLDFRVDAHPGGAEASRRGCDPSVLEDGGAARVLSLLADFT